MLRSLTALLASLLLSLPRQLMTGLIALRGHAESGWRPPNRAARRLVYFMLPRALRRASLWLLGTRALPAMAGGATIVGTRSPLFYRKVAGGLPAIIDTSKFSGNVFYVDSGAAAASDTAGFGTEPDAPFKTINYARSQCTANQGDVILVLPGHVETVTAADGIALSVAGIWVLGLGTGAARPRVNFTTAAAATVSVGAANVRVTNILFTCSIDEQTIMLDLNSADTLIELCEFRGSATAQPLTMIDINGGAANACDRVTISGCKLISYTAAAGTGRGIELGEVADEVTIADCVIDTNSQDASIHNPVGKILTNLRLLRNVIRNRNSGNHAVELVSACTGEAVGNSMFGDTAAAIFDPGSLFTAGNKFGQAIDQESFDYIPLWPVAAAYANGVSPSAVLGYIQDGVRRGTGTTMAANKSVADALGFDGSAQVAATAGMVRVMAGTRFVVKKTLTSSAVVQAGVDVTLVSTVGDILIEDYTVQADGTGLAAGTNFTMECNNAKGSAVFHSNGVAGHGANSLIDKKVATTGKSVVLETGKKVVAKCTIADCTGVGTIDVYLLCRRLADNATLAAA